MIRVLVVAHVRLFREGIASFLETQPGIAVVGAAEPEEAADLVTVAEPEIVLVDIPDRAGLATVRHMAELAPEVKVVAVGISEAEDDIIACAQAGIAGYVLRDGSLEDLVTAIETAAREELACSPSVAAMLLRCVGRHVEEGTDHPAQRRLDALTRREAEIVDLIADDLSNKQIAAALHVSLSTIKNHIHSVMQKLDTSSRGEIAHLVQAAGPAPRHGARRARSAARI